MSYDFSTLNDKDLEELALDLLNAELNLGLQSFKVGKDGGVDLRCSTPENNNEIVVQVKHYLKSGFTKFKSDLINKELPKVRNLKLKRYLIVTSLPISNEQKDAIKKIFEPFIVSSNDIYGNDDLNRLLRINPKIEENHFKLWLSSVTVLKKILNNGINERSEFTKGEILKRIKIFVPSNTYRNAIEIVNKNGFILITGAPGIGKTTLANFLTYQFLAKDFELIYVREIKEAEEKYSTGKKQVFYFDDFLGSITLDLKSSRNVDSSIIEFVNRIKSDKQKRLILTCRTTILNKAKQESEKIENSKFENQNYELNIENYDKLDKAKILYNHIYNSNLSEELQLEFFKNQFYWKIINHIHYNPRIIEFFTDTERIDTSNKYTEEVIDFLNKPEKIWLKSYTKQISHDARLFLSTLYSLGGKYTIEESLLNEAFEARLDYERENNNYSKVGGTFNKVVEELIGGFINRIHRTESSYEFVEYKFLNPSIEDFLFDYFSKNIDEYITILKAAIKIGQFNERICTKFDANSKRIYFNKSKNYNKLLVIFKNKLNQFQNNKIEAIEIMTKLFEWKDIKEIVVELMDTINIKNISWSETNYLIQIFHYISDNKLINEFNFSFKSYLLELSGKFRHYTQIQSFSNLISKHKAYNDIIVDSKKEDQEYFIKFQNNINISWDLNINSFLQQTYKLNNITEKKEMEILIIDKIKDVIKINESFHIEKLESIASHVFNYEEQITNNKVLLSEKSIEIKNIVKNANFESETILINRLFNSNDEDEYNELPF